MDESEKAEAIAAYVRTEMARNPPRSQEDVCRLSARASIRVGDCPRNDFEFRWAAEGQAQGLFGPAYVSADHAQRQAWIRMCERALREEAAVCGLP